MNNDHILYAFDILKSGLGQRLEGNDIANGLKRDALAWVHLDANSLKTQAWLEKELTYLDTYVTSALLENETRPRMMPIGTGGLVILRGINLNNGDDAEDMVSIRLYIDQARIISVERRPLKAVEDIVTALRTGKGPKDAGDFLVSLCRLLTGRIESVIAQLDDETDALEEKLIEQDNLDIRKDITSIRQKAIQLRRHMAPQREALSQLRILESPWLEDVDQRGLFETYNQTTRMVEELDAVRERAQIIKDELASQLSDRLNRNTYVLSVIAAIFLPLGFLTGLFGINIGGMPGVENGSAFMVFSTSLIFIVILQIWIFKKLKWF